MEALVAESPSRASMDTDLADLDRRFASVSIDFGAADAVIKVTANDYEHALGEHGPQHAQGERRTFDRVRKIWDVWLTADREMWYTMDDFVEGLRES